jgi:lactoylglutathione lyase
MPVHFLGAIFIRVTNLERSIDFYSNILGIRFRGIEHWNPGRGATFFLHPDQDVWPLMTLIEVEKVQTLEYPAFNLNSTNVVEMQATLQSLGFHVSNLEEWTASVNHHIMFDIHDPDGHPINIIEVIPLKVGLGT